jgi:hypothetical protein
MKDQGENIHCSTVLRALKESAFGRLLTPIIGIVLSDIEVLAL